MSRWQLLWEPSIFEFAALPGTGKTTVARALLQRSGKRSWLAPLHKVLRKSPLVWPFHVTTLIRYRRLYADLVEPAASPALQPARARRGGALLRILFSMRGRRSPAYRSIRKKLSALHMEHCLLRVETILRRRIAVLDEGYVQRGLAVCLRTPPHRHRAVWHAYLEAVPSGVRCLMLEGGIDVAMRRALARTGGVPAIMESSDLATQCSHLAEILKSDALAEKLHVARVQATGDTAATVNRTLEALARETDTTRMLLFIRGGA